MPVSGSYFYPGQVTPPALGNDTPYQGKGPVAAFIIGSSGTITTTGAGASGSNSVSIITLSGTYFEQTSSFNGASYSIVFNSTDVSNFGNVSITMVNNSTNMLQSASIEWSPNNSQFEQWDTTSFASLSASGGIKSMQISGNSRRYLRIRAISSGSGGQLTGSLDVYVICSPG